MKKIDEKDQFNFSLESIPNEDKIIISYWKEEIIIDLENGLYYVHDFTCSFSSHLDITEIFEIYKIDLSDIEYIKIPDKLFEEEFKYSNLFIFLSRYSIEFNNELMKKKMDSILVKSKWAY